MALSTLEGLVAVSALGGWDEDPGSFMDGCGNCWRFWLSKEGFPGVLGVLEKEVSVVWLFFFDNDSR